MGCAALAAVSLPSIAAEDVELSEVVVTAQFREQDLQKTPIAITAVNNEMMEARSQNSLNQIADQAPSITLAPQAGAYGPSMAIFMRGVGQYDFNPAFEPGVGIYVDDVYFPTLTGSIMDLLDLDRVEILRGPQGTLAGRNSIGGAVKLYSRLPDGTSSSTVAATYGTRKRFDVRASADFALTDSIFARISGVSKNQDGYVKRLDYGCVYPSSGIPRNLSSNTHCVLAREGEINYDAVRGIVRFDNGGPIKDTFIVDYTDDDRIAGATVLLAAKPLGSAPTGFTPNADVDPWGSGLGLDAFVPAPGSYINYGTYTMERTANRPPRNTPGRAYFRSRSASNNLEVALSDSLQLVSITAYQDYDSGFQNDNDLSPLNQQIGDGTQPMHAFTQELRLNGTVGDSAGGGHLDWTVGGFYLDQLSWYPSYQDLRYSLLPFQQDDPIDASAKAAFAHLSFVASDRLTLLGGLRYTKESKTYEYSRKTPDGAVHPQLGGLDGVVGPYSGDKLDWRVGAQFQLTDNFMTYASIATGFKGGGVNPRPFYPEQAVGFDPEEETSYEVGAKTELLDRHLRLNTALFYTDYKGFQGSAQTCPPQYTQTGPICSLIINVGTAHVKGVELETNYESGSGLTLDASASYLDFRVVSLSPLAVGGAISVGNTAVYTPKWKWSVGLQRQFHFAGGQTLTPRIDASYKSSVYSTVNNFERSKIDGYTVANARLTWRSSDNNLEISGECTNVFDKYYITTIYDAWDRAGIISGAPGHPREWAVTLKKRF
jgi:iron complex outermembrane receptor protein